MIGGFIGTPIGGVINISTTFLPVTAGSYALSGQTALFKPSVTVTAGSYTISGSVGLFVEQMVASAGVYAIVGQPAILTPKAVAVAGSYAISGNAATFGSVLHVGTGIVVGGYIGGGIGGVIYQAAPKPDATYQITGQSAAFIAGEVANAGSYALSGASIAFKLTMAAAPGAYVITGTVAFSQVINGAGGETRPGYRGKLELERRKIRITDDEGRARQVDMLRHLKPPPAFTGPAPDWALGKAKAAPSIPTPGISSGDDERAFAPAPAMPAARLPQSLLALQDAKDENELVEFLTNTPDPLVEDIRQMLGVLAASGQLQAVLENA